MKDDEVEELLRRTLRHRAEKLRPSASLPPGRVQPVEALKEGRRRRPPFVLGGLAVAAAIALALALAILLPRHPSPHTSVAVSSPPPVPSSKPAPAPAVTLPVQTTVAAPATPPPTTTRPSLDLGPVPAGFVPVSVTFVSSRTGWVLGRVPCAQGGCASLARTTDGGVTWSEVPTPARVPLPTQVSSTVWQPALVRFADPEDGWIALTSPDGVSTLWSTHNGGYGWSQVPVPAGSQATIEDIEASDYVVHMVVASAGFSVYTSPASLDRWSHDGGIGLPYGGGPVPAASLSLQGQTGWILDMDRTVVGGARLSSAGAWSPWNPPACSGAQGSGVLAASSATRLIAICEEGVWGTPTTPAVTGPYPAEWLFQSADGGSSFTAVGKVPATVTGATQPAGVAATVLAGTGSGLIATFDGGKHWQSVYSSGAAASFVGFTTGSQGVAVVGGSLVMTGDGGHSWRVVSFR
jgi:photosystem II stability/assembly factor-like uncharacterized protein